jgi:hypothetical protein
MGDRAALASKVARDAEPLPRHGNLSSQLLDQLPRLDREIDGIGKKPVVGGPPVDIAAQLPFR